MKNIVYKHSISPVNRHKAILLLIASVSVPFLVPAGCGNKGLGHTRPAQWAVRVKKRGLKNFYRVDANLYRGAQPNRVGMKELADMGIKSVVNLRSLHSDKDELRGLPLEHYHIKFNTVRPKTEYVVQFLSILKDPDKVPVFVHCAHGADRTGTMVAFYRIIYQGWTKKQAIQEMTRGGYNFHSIWIHLIKFIRYADIEHIKRKLMLSKKNIKPRPI